MSNLIALPEFIIQRQGEIPRLTGGLSRILRDIGLSAKIVNRAVNKAGLTDILGSTGEINVQGETVQKLDSYANQLFISSFTAGGRCCAVVTEENQDLIAFDVDDTDADNKYIVAIDPLDGSSNIDVNVSVGTIFGIFKRISKSGHCTIEDFLQPGVKQVAAGYVIYGSSTMLVYTTGHGVNGFTLEPSIGEFCLSHPDIQMPKRGRIYSVNQANFYDFNKGVQHYINHLKNSEPKYTLRYIGSMVADFHRSLIKGGIFMYPATKQSPNGKLRLLYECNPLAFIAEQAGGRASDGTRRILEIKPTELHQRVPILLGSEDMVLEAEQFIAEFNSEKQVG